MKTVSERKIIVVTKQTRADELVKKFNNMTQAAFYVEKMGGDIAEYVEESRVYKKSVSVLFSQLQELARVQQIDREYVSSFLFGDDDIVVVIGQDGLVLGKITDSLQITSQMPENGVIFSDGIGQDFLQFNSGIGARISVAAKKGYLVV